jgi:hypothetical protein
LRGAFDGEFKIGTSRADEAGMRRLGFFAVLLVLVAGCSSPASGPSPSASARVSAPAPSPASPAQLELIVLHTADLPAGWTGSPHVPDTSSAADAAEMAACVGVPNSEKNKVSEANSDSFALGDATISSSASSYRSQSDIDTDLALLTNPKTAQCYEQLMKKTLATSLPAGATVDSTSFTITPGSAGGPANVAATLTGTVTVSVSGQKVEVYPTIVFITGKQLEAEVDVMNLGSPVPAATMSTIVAAVATRAAAV